MAKSNLDSFVTGVCAAAAVSSLLDNRRRRTTTREVVVVERPVYHRSRAAMSRGEFGFLLESMSRECFDDDKLSVLRAALRGRYEVGFTANQAEQILQQFRFDDNRLSACYALQGKCLKVPHCRCFNFSSDAQRGRKILMG